MVIPSPYTNRARADQPFDTELQRETAFLLSTRIVDWQLAGRLPQYPSDAFYLRNATATWLAGRFLQVRTEAYLIENLAENYGDATITQLLSVLQPTDTIAALSTATGVFPLNGLNVNWQDFLAWRLSLEDELIQARDEANWQTLYDMNDAGLRDIAYGRFTTGLVAESWEILEVVPTTSAAGVPQLQVRTQVIANGEVQERIILFSLVDNVWKRAN